MDVAAIQKLRTAADRHTEGRRSVELLGEALRLVGGELTEVRRRAEELLSTPAHSASHAGLHLLGSGGKGVRLVIPLHTGMQSSSEQCPITSPPVGIERRSGELGKGAVPTTGGGPQEQ